MIGVAFSQFGLPDYFGAVLGEDAIGGEDGQVFGEGLGDEEAIEGVAVVVGEGFEVEDVVVADGE